MVSPHVITPSLSSVTFGYTPQRNSDITQVPALTYAHSGDYIAATGSASDVCNIQPLIVSPPEIVTAGEDTLDPQFFDRATFFTYPVLGSGLIRSPHWYGYDQVVGVSGTGATQSTFFAPFTLPACYDPDYPIAIGFTAALRSESGLDPLSHSAVHQYGSVAISLMSCNGGDMSNQTSMFWDLGDVFGLSTTGHTYTPPINTPTSYSFNMFPTLNEWTATANNPGWGTDYTGPVGRDMAPGDSASVYFQLIAGTAYGSGDYPFVSPDPTWLEVSNITVTFQGDCAAQRTQGHIF